MKSKFIHFLFAASLFTSCKKDDKAPEPPKDIIQLTKAETGEGTLRFSYNEQNMLSKISITSAWDDNSPVLGYWNINYVNGLPEKAEQYINSGTGPRKVTEYIYHLDGAKKISYVARNAFNSTGGISWQDTLDFTFNAEGRLISLKWREEDATVENILYDNRGNIREQNTESRTGNEIFATTFNLEYDNNINPFAVNGLGITVYSILNDGLLSRSQLFSANNRSKYYQNYKRTTLDDHNQPVSVIEDNYTTDFTNTFDSNGGLTTIRLDWKYRRLQNGNNTASQDEQAQYRYACVKKQQ